MSDAEFDKAYMQHMVSDHQEDVKAFEKQSSGSGDAALKECAKTTLPTLREHLAEAQRIAGKLGATTSRQPLM